MFASYMADSIICNKLCKLIMLDISVHIFCYFFKMQANLAGIAMHTILVQIYTHEVLSFEGISQCALSDKYTTCQYMSEIVIRHREQARIHIYQHHVTTSATQNYREQSTKARDT